MTVVPRRAVPAQNPETSYLGTSYLGTGTKYTGMAENGKKPEFRACPQIQEG
jgi:hypothetical protein